MCECAEGKGRAARGRLPQRCSPCWALPCSRPPGAEPRAWTGGRKMHGLPPARGLLCCEALPSEPGGCAVVGMVRGLMWGSRGRASPCQSPPRPATEGSSRGCTGKGALKAREGVAQACSSPSGCSSWHVRTGAEEVCAAGHGVMSGDARRRRPAATSLPGRCMMGWVGEVEGVRVGLRDWAGCGSCECLCGLVGCEACMASEALALHFRHLCAPPVPG